MFIKHTENKFLIHVCKPQLPVESPLSPFFMKGRTEKLKKCTSDFLTLLEREQNPNCTSIFGVLTW